MKSLWMASVLFLSTAAWAQETEAPAEGAPAKAAAKPKTKKAPLDVSKMPFTPDSIKRVMTHDTESIQECYEETMAQKNKAVDGKVLTSFVITQEGLVKKAKVERSGTTIKDSHLHECVVDVITALTFPKPPDGREHPVQYPFNLKAIR